jgi:ribosome-associated toxin RatA of RatAB toxin-antitoxin module
MQITRSLLLVATLLATPLAGASDARNIDRYEVKTPHASVPAGGARANVFAPSGVVRGVVTDYKNYTSIITRFDKARVVGRSGDQTDVYLEVPIMKRAAKIWAVVRFDPPKLQGGEELIVGRMLKGNVKRLDATWRIRRVDDQNSELKLELLIVPRLPVPSSLILSEQRGAAARGVEGVRTEAEKRHGQGVN